MQIPEARWIVFGTLTLFTVMIALYVSFYFRDLAFGKSDDDADLMTDFRQMRDEGHLGDEEFSKLKKVIPKTGDLQTSGVHVGSKQKATSEQEPEPEKKFLTLAEAQRLKNQSSADESEQTTETETNHEDEANNSE